jgi:hypothetical protein
MSSSNGHLPENGTAVRGGYSSIVRLWLRQNGTVLEPGQVGGGRLYFDEPVQLASGEAELTIEVDGDADRKRVLISAPPIPSKIVRYSPLETTDAAA